MLCIDIYTAGFIRPFSIWTKHPFGAFPSRGWLFVLHFFIRDSSEMGFGAAKYSVLNDKKALSSSYRASWFNIETPPSNSIDCTSSKLTSMSEKKHVHLFLLFRHFLNFLFVGNTRSNIVYIDKQTTEVLKFVNNVYK